MKLKRGNLSEVLAWSGYDFANSAFATSILAVIFNQYYAVNVAGGASGTEIEILGRALNVPGATIFQYAVGISMLMVIVTAPILGAAADHSNNKKSFLGFLCAIGCLFTGLLYFVRAGDVISGGIFFIIANYAFAGGNVFYNGLLLDVAHPDDFGKVSGFGWGVGYLGGGLCLVLNLIMLTKPSWLGLGSMEITVHHTFPVVAIWWGIFAIPLFLMVRERGRREISQKVNLVRVGFSRVKRTFREIRKYKHLGRFLLSYMLFNEGIETTIITASIFGAEIIGLKTAEIIVFFLVVQATAFAGSLIFGFIVDAIGNKKSLLITLVVWTVIIIWARFIGCFWELKTEFYLLGILTGLVLGGSQSAARSLQAAFTPADKGAEFFGFFAICGKFAAMLGPFIFGTTVLITGDLKSGILILLVFFLLGGLLTVDEEEGIASGRV